MWPESTSEKGNDAMSSYQIGKSPRGFFGHPSGLGWLFSMEMCERFSYYGMRAILLYFVIDEGINGGLGISEPIGQALVAAYGASAYLLAIVGGILADRVVGLWKATLYGGVVIMFGHLALTLPTSPMSWVGICCIALGTGLLKPNLQAMFGEVYAEGDPRRHGGFQLMYFSVNIGAFLAPFVIGGMRAAGGYHAGFSAAAIGMALSLVIFIVGRSRMPESVMAASQPLSNSGQRRLFSYTLGSAVAVAALFLGFIALLPNITDAIVGTVATVAAVVAVAYFVTMFRSKKVNADERSNLRAYLPLWLAAMVVWMIEEQAAVKMASFALSNTQLNLGSFGIPPEWYQSINPWVCLIAAPILAYWFTRRAGKFPGVIHKFIFGTVLLGISALLMGVGFATWTGGESLAPWWYLALVFVVQTTGIVFISPVGAAATTLLMPRAFKGQGMAVWLLNNALAQGLAAVIIRLLAGVNDSVFYYILTAATVVTVVVLGVLATRISAITSLVEGAADRSPQSDVEPIGDSRRA